MGCQITNVKCERTDTPIVDIKCTRTGTPIVVTCSIACEVGIGDFIRFTLSSLQWAPKDNYIGATKYNKLTSSGAWSLEEVEIEELL